jgi:hypothetical protein
MRFFEVIINMDRKTPTTMRQLSLNQRAAPFTLFSVKMMAAFCSSIPSSYINSLPGRRWTLPSASPIAPSAPLLGVVRQNGCNMICLNTKQRIHMTFFLRLCNYTQFLRHGHQRSSVRGWALPSRMAMGSSWWSGWCEIGKVRLSGKTRLRLRLWCTMVVSMCCYLIEGIIPTDRLSSLWSLWGKP